MNAHAFTFRETELRALPSGALHWPGENLLAVSDLHLGKSARLSAVGGAQLPPYETRETLLRLQGDLEATGARTVLCLGDSFDAPGLDLCLPEEDTLWIARLQAGREWIWVEGNHDPGPVALGGSHRSDLRRGPFTFRHIAAPAPEGEISGHFHPKARLPLRGRTLTAPCFLCDAQRLILPAYGAYTGGLFCDRAPLEALMAPDAQAILALPRPVAIPMPRRAAS